MEMESEKNMVACERQVPFQMHSGRGCACMKAREDHQWEGLGHQ